MSEMTLHEALLSRRTAYSFTDEAIPDDVVDRALDAVRWAPNHKLTQPWRVVLVGPDTRARIAAVAEILAERKAAGCSSEEIARMQAKAKKKFTQIGGLAVVLQKLPEGADRNALSDDDAFVIQEDYAAVCCGLHNFVLSLWADGVASLWGTGGITRNPEVLQLLGKADDEDVVGFVRFGRPEKVPKQQRHDVDSYVRHLP